MKIKLSQYCRLIYRCEITRTMGAKERLLKIQTFSLLKAHLEIRDYRDYRLQKERLLKYKLS